MLKVDPCCAAILRLFWVKTVSVSVDELVEISSRIVVEI